MIFTQSFEHSQVRKLRLITYNLKNAIFICVKFGAKTKAYG